MGEKRKRQRQSHSWGCKSEGEQKLCDEAIEEILLHVPPPALARFKCVSSRWCCRLSKPSFIDRYKATNLSLLGFLYNKAYDRVRFQPIVIPEKQQNHVEHQQATMIDILMATDSTDNSYCLVNSSNGLQLLYFSKFRNRDGRTDPYFVVRNFVSGSVTGIPNCQCLSYPSETKSIRFLVFGFYFDPYNEKPNFTIVEITSDGRFGNGAMHSFKYNSLLPDFWEHRFHKAPTPSLVDGKAGFDEYCRLSGPSTFLNGSLHWLLEPYGIAAFKLQEQTLIFRLNIPGDRECCIYNNGFCRCIKKIREGGCYSNGECSCRYLGEVRDQLVYIRVTGDFVLSMWILENYNKSIWSHTRRIVVGGLPPSTPSLFFGRVLAFDRTDAHVLYLRVKRTVFSYNIVDREANEIFEISKDYGGEDNCLGFIIPYEFPRIPLSIWYLPLIVRNSPDSSDTGGMIKCKVNYAKGRGGNLNAIGTLQNSRPGISQAAINSFSHLVGVDNVGPTALPFYDYCPPVVSNPKSRQVKPWLDLDKLETFKKNEDGLITLYRHFAVSQVAVKYFPDLQPLDDITGPPVRSTFDFKAPNTYDPVWASTLFYNDLVRVEDCLYGSVYESGRGAHQNDD